MGFNVLLQATFRHAWFLLHISRTFSSRPRSFTDHSRINIYCTKFKEPNLHFKITEYLKKISYLTETIYFVNVINKHNIIDEKYICSK
jgi:hypothetical protein